MMDHLQKWQIIFVSFKYKLILVSEKVYILKQSKISNKNILLDLVSNFTHFTILVSCLGLGFACNFEHLASCTADLRRSSRLEDSESELGRLEIAVPRESKMLSYGLDITCSNIQYTLLLNYSQKYICYWMSND